MDEQGLQQGAGAGVAESQPGMRAPVSVISGAVRSVMLGAADRVVAEALDAQEAPVGGEADLPQGGQAGQPLERPKSRVSLIVVSVRSALPSLWYCLILVFL